MHVWTKFPKYMIESEFRGDTSGGDIRGNHRDYGVKYVDTPLAFRVSGDRNVSFQGKLCDQEGQPAGAQERFQNIFVNFNLKPMSNIKFHRVLAERDVQPEQMSKQLSVRSNGVGLTNLVRAFLHDSRFDSSKVEVDLLDDLNLIFSGDCLFDRVLCREDSDAATWEIYLRESTKGDVRLSLSGSALKTVFLILAYIHLVPIANPEQNINSAVIAIEEPENNLHPALLRRLLNYLAEKRSSLSSMLILTTHSPVCIDWAARRQDSTIVHVRASNGGSVCTNVLDYSSRSSILDDLDIRGSDLLQSNGIIWVEGPSDRIYVRAWIDLSSGGLLTEGVHYSFLYYGGKILNHFDGATDQELTTRVSMLTVNRNVAVIMDSDRRPTAAGSRKPRMNLNATKTRIIQEVRRVNGFAWVTDGKEVENYIPNSVWEKVVSESAKRRGEGTSPFPDRGQYDAIPDRKELADFRGHKVEIANAVVSQLEVGDLDRLDLKERIEELCQVIRRWNRLG